MKNFGFLFPLAVFAVTTTVGYQLLSRGVISMPVFILITAGGMMLMAMIRPKSAAQKPAPDAINKALGEYAKDAFTDDSKVSAAFRSAVKDFSGNMPKSAINKLNKLAPQCRTDEERYAVAMVAALCHIAGRNYEAAILEYNRAVVIHPTSELAYTIGTYQQRIGELKQARSSYEFALDLDPSNIEARSGMATAFVASRKYEQALEHAMMALELDENFASALATAAICYGIQEDNMLYKHYTAKAVENGYSEIKIKDTVKALKK